MPHPRSTLLLHFSPSPSLFPLLLSLSPLHNRGGLATPVLAGGGGGRTAPSPSFPSDPGEGWAAMAAERRAVVVAVLPPPRSRREGQVGHARGAVAVWLPSTPLPLPLPLPPNRQGRATRQGDSPLPPRSGEGSGDGGGVAGWDGTVRLPSPPLLPKT